MQPQKFVVKNHENYETMYCENNNINNNNGDASDRVSEKVYLYATENAREDMTTLYNMWLDSCLFDDNITDNG
ncbi:MAG: hypothetical protein RLZ54_751 [Candidatus Parcubacteria bacterium]|jgi:hypothetical protein